MRKIGLAVFLLAVAIVLASVLVWLRQRNAWQPPPPLKPELPLAMELPALANPPLAAALAQPLFWPSRRPNPVAPAAGKGPKDELDDAQLTAVLQAGPHRIALLRQKDGSPLKVSDNSRPWRIESFDGRKAIFVSNRGQRAERLLEATGAAGAVGAANGGSPSAPAGRPPQGPAPGPDQADPERAAPPPQGTSDTRRGRLP